MGERKNRKLLSDTEDETKHMSEMREHNSWAGKDHHSSYGRLGSGCYNDFSDSRTTCTRDSRDHFGWASWEPIEEHPIASMSRNFKNTYEAKEMSGGKRYRKNISPGFEEMELHSYNPSNEYDRSHSQRYMGKERNMSQSRRRTRRRSRSRSRTRRRSWNRSLSKGRKIERKRGGDWSRSRSRSDGYGYTNDLRRSHSPIGDYRRQSNGWGDKRGSPEKSSQTCRDFTSGRCWKGSRCIFFHPTSISRKDGDLVEDDRVESWRSRSDHSQISKLSYTRLRFESLNDVSDLYHGEDEQYLHRSRSRSRSSIPCRDFKQGYCRWGDSCRFSHDAASADSFGQEIRNCTFDKDEFDHHQHKNRKPLCKFFVAGKCNRDNCRFSHGDPNLNNLEGRLDKVTESKSSHDKNWWNAPKWDAATRISDTPMSTGWGEAIATNTTSSCDATNGQSDDTNLNNQEGRLDKVTENQSSRDKNWWNAPKWDAATRISDTPMSTGWGEAIVTNTTSSCDATNGHSDDTNLNNQEGRLDKVTESQSSRDKNWWNAPKWDAATRISNTPMSTGWGEAIATNTTSSCDATNGHSDDTNLNNQEGRLDKVTESQSSRDKNWWNAPKWDAATRISNTPMSTGWGEAIATNTTSSYDATNGQSDDRWGLNSKNENKWGIHDWTSNSLDSEIHHSLLGKSGSYGRDTGPAKSIVVDHMPNKQEHLIFHDLQLQNKNRIANLHVLSALEENQSLTVEALQQNVPPASHIQQQHCELIKSNPMTSFGSSVLDEVKDTRYANHPVLLSGEGFNQNGASMFPGNSSVLNESDRAQNMLYTNLSIGHGTDLKRPETHIINPLNVQIHAQNDKKAVLSPGFLEAKVPQILTNLLTSMHSDKVSNSPVTNASQQVSSVTDPISMIQSFVNERSLTYAGIDVSSSGRMLPSFSSTTGSLPLVSTTCVQDNVHAASLDQFNSVGNDKEYNEPGNYNLAQGTDQNNEMQLGRSSPSPIVASGIESPKLKHPESPRQQVEVVADVGVTGDSKATGDESKEVQDRPSEDGKGKHEECNANKDEKVLRLFKNSLVEFVKEILKPIWKEGHMSREVHINVVKKVVDKVSSTIQVDHIPKTQDKIDQYMMSSKPKITKLVQAYAEHCRKTDT